MRTILIVSFSVIWIAGAALAQTSSPTPTLKSPDSAAPSASGSGDTAGKESGKAKSAAADALASCLTMWDAATHMSRRQWARACRRVAERLKSTTLE